MAMQRTPAILTPRTAFFSRLLFFHRAGQTGCARQRQPYNNHARLTRIPAWSRKANTLAMTISTTPVANSRSNVSFFISRSPRTYHSLFLVLYSTTVPDLPARDFPPRRSVIPFSFPLFLPCIEGKRIIGLLCGHSVLCFGQWKEALLWMQKHLDSFWQKHAVPVG